MNWLYPDVVVQVDDDGSHQIGRGTAPLSRANHCGTKNVFADDGFSLANKADFADFLMRQLQPEVLVDRADWQKDEAEAADVQTLEEHQRFKTGFFQKDEAAMIFKSGKAGWKAE